MSQAEPIAILGAGLSGLSLACALVEEGVRRPVVLLDRRTAWERDRTWCTWLTPGLRFSELARHRWGAWQVRAGAATAVGHSTRHPYVCFAAEDVYAGALRRLAAAPRVSVRTGVGVLGVEAGDAPGAGGRGGLVVSTTEGAVPAGVVVNALGLGSPLTGPRTPGEVALVQRFLGWEVETDRPVFDPAVATLMDFRDAAGDGVRFLYTLPFSPHTALVEDTSIGTRAVTADARRAVLTEAMDERAGASRWRVVREERGSLPMTDAAFPLHRTTGAERVHAVGTAGGALRPSSGYAFSRIQRHSTLVARALVAGRPLPERVAPARLDRLDAIFLRALRDEPHRFPDVFRRMVARVPDDAFARFMVDASSPVDEARLLAAVPPGPFLRAAARRTTSHVPWPAGADRR